MEIKRICEKYTGSSLWGMNGGLPESPDGKLLVYARKCVIDDPAKRETEIWIAERETPEHAHKLFTVQCGNHNGPSKMMNSKSWEGEYMTNAITRFFSYIIIVIWLCIPIVAETEDFLCLDKPQRIAVFSLDAEEILLSLVPCERIAYVGHAYFDDGGLYSPTMYLTFDMPGEQWQNSDEEFLLGLDLDLLILPDDLAYYYGNGLFDDLYVSNVPVLFIKAPNTIDDIRSNIFIIGGRFVNLIMLKN